MDKKNNKPKAFWLLRIFGGKWQFLTIPLLSILFSLIAISIIVLLIGKNPLTTLTSLLQGSGWLPRPHMPRTKTCLPTSPSFWMR